MNKATEQLLELIKKWLRLRRTTQTELAHALGIKQPSLSGMMSGKKKLPKKRLQEIIKLLNPDESDINEACRLYIESEQETDLDALSYKNKADFKFNPSDQTTCKLLEYWSELSDSKKYEILSILAQIKEREDWPSGIKNSFCERNLDIHNSEITKETRNERCNQRNRATDCSDVPFDSDRRSD